MEKFVPTKTFEETLQILGINIVSARKSKNYSQVALSEICELSQPHISIIEAGKSDIELKTLVKLAITFDMELLEILSNQEPVHMLKVKYLIPQIEERLGYEKIKIGERIAELKNHRDLDQEELGILSNIENSHISEYLNGLKNLTLSTIFNISAGLEVSMYEPFNYGGSLPNNKNFIGKK